MGTPMVLELSGIKKSFGGIKALKGVNFQLKLGEVHGLLGENGAGKSTLIKIITGVYQADDGSIRRDGSLVTIETPAEARKKGIAAIYQELSLIESLTVAENIFLGNEPTISALGIYDRKTLYKKSQTYLDEFGINIDCRKNIAELGMGQKRIVEIVKALAVDARILLLDEPTTGMSKAEIEILFQIMDNLKKKDVTMIYISHYLDEVFRIADRATVFRDGENIETYRMNEVTKDTLVKAMIGRVVASANSSVKKDLKEKDIILELKDFKSSRMKEPVSFRIRKSEILGITGIVGAGKSELAQSIFGNAVKESGEIFLHGKPIKVKTPYDAGRYGLGFIPEDRKAEGLFLKESVADNIVISDLDQLEGRFGVLDRSKKEAVFHDMTERLHVFPKQSDLPAGNLSGGNQQKVVIGKWLCKNPDIMIMDEPTRGIDVGAKTEIYEIIRQLSSQDKSVIVMSSEFEELTSLCDRILVLYKGAIVAEVTPADVTNEELLSLSLGG